MRLTIAWLCTILMVSSGCGPRYSRVALPTVPSASAPEDERRRALAELTPSGQIDLVSVHTRGGPVTQTTELVMLGNGTRVADPRDLLPAVLPNSATARYATEFDVKVTRASPIMTSSLIGILASVALMGTSAVVGASSFASHNSDPGAFLGLLAAASGTFVVGLALGFWGIFVAKGADTDRNAAFLAYPNDLQRKLGFLDAPQFAGTPQAVPASAPAAPVPAAAAPAPSSPPAEPPESRE